MADVQAGGGAHTLRGALLEALADPARLDAGQHARFAAAPAGELDAALRAVAAEHGAAALPLLSALASERAGREVRRVARRALYRLAQRGVTPPASPARGPVVARRQEQASRAWLSGVDGSGSRAVWIVFEGAFGDATLCSLIVNDVTGIVEVAGGPVTKKRLAAELDGLRASQKLPWVESDPARAVGLVAEALALHRARGAALPRALTRWQRLFESAPPPAPIPEAAPDPALAARAAELLELPELAGWFVDPEAVQSDALELLEARASRLVVSEHIKAERESAIVTRVVEREFSPEARRRWARRLREMVLVFAATGRADIAAVAGAVATTLAATSDVARDPFAVSLAQRGLEYAGEVAAGRVSAADVSRAQRG
ncbi:MAG TPA: hypothetical protein VMR23_11625 [Candidatus Limnocylindria bacterium]|nr:hypothetical protein [Candidatus Limnocylindria bacterium]